jgi:hypothetical protein
MYPYFLCNVCNYSTENKYNFIKHCKSKSHLQREISTFTCGQCNKKFNDDKTYKIHKYNVHNQTKITLNKNIKIIKENVQHIKIDNDRINKKQDKIDQKQDKIDQKQDKIDQKQDKIDQKQDKIDQKQDKIDQKQEIILLQQEENKNELKHDIKVVKHVVNKAISKASSLIKYLMEHHKDVPPLKKITSRECINRLRIDLKCPKTINNKHKLERELIYQYKYKIFVQKISESILHLVYYLDKNKQPIWNIDTARKNFVVKTSETKWNSDVSGKRFINYIINPLLHSISELITKYREYMEENKNLYDNNNYYIKYMVDVTGFECDLNLEKFTQPILKYLTPYLKYIEDELEKIENFEKLKNDFFKIVEQVAEEDELKDLDLDNDNYKDDDDSLFIIKGLINNDECESESESESEKFNNNKLYSGKSFKDFKKKLDEQIVNADVDKNDNELTLFMKLETNNNDDNLNNNNVSVSDNNIIEKPKNNII